MLTTVKMSVLLEKIYRFNKISIQNPARFCVEIDKLTLKLTLKFKILWIIKTN